MAGFPVPATHNTPVLRPVRKSLELDSNQQREVLQTSALPLELPRDNKPARIRTLFFGFGGQALSQEDRFTLSLRLEEIDQQPDTSCKDTSDT